MRLAEGLTPVANTLLLSSESLKLSLVTSLFPSVTVLLFWHRLWVVHMVYRLAVPLHVGLSWLATF